MRSSTVETGASGLVPTHTPETTISLIEKAVRALGGRFVTFAGILSGSPATYLATPKHSSEKNSGTLDREEMESRPQYQNMPKHVQDYWKSIAVLKHGAPKEIAEVVAQRAHDEYYLTTSPVASNIFERIIKETKEEMARKTSNAKTWDLIEAVAPHARRVLLFGPPGTGKSYTARTAGVKNPAKVFPIVVHSDLPAAELRGHFVPQKEGGLKWMDGPAVSAWRSGGRLVLDEIDKAGDDALSFMLGVLDDEKTAMLTLGTTGEVLKPHEEFTVWATMNGIPEDLPEALQDRFPISVQITEPHPGAIAALPPEFRNLAASLSMRTDDSRIGIRQFYEYARLKDKMNPEHAAELTFGATKWYDLKTAIDAARVTDPQ